MLIIQKTKTDHDALTNNIFINCEAHDININNVRDSIKKKKVKFNEKTYTSDDMDVQPYELDQINSKPILMRSISEYDNLYLQIKNKFYKIKHDDSILKNVILMNSAQRRENDKSDIDISNINTQIHTKKNMEKIHKFVTYITIHIKKVFLLKDRHYTVPEIDNSDILTQLEKILRNIRFLGNNQSYLIPITIGCEDIHCQIQTYSPIYDRYKMYNNTNLKQAKQYLDIINETKEIIVRDQNLFDFDDIRKSGIGGLDKEFDEIFRRVFASRMLGINIVRKLNIKHIKGLILFGPSGCGKTLLARQISRSLKSINPIIINGPEIVSKYVGETEQNLRNIFKPAIQDYELFGDESKLHVIIFDEIDSICSHRSNFNNSDSNACSNSNLNSNPNSNSNSNINVTDRTVDQFLTLMDGINVLNNILVIGITNRMNVIDKALLRPGRFEVQIEIGLPDRKGRLDILNIHTDKLRRNGFFDQNINLEELADVTDNFTGAEIEGLINSARSHAMYREIDKSMIHDSNKRVDRFQITYIDVTNAMKDIESKLFFSNSRQIETMYASIAKFGMYFFDKDIRNKFEHIKGQILNISNSKDYQRSPYIVAVTGYRGFGKTTTAINMAKISRYSNIRYIDPADYIGLTEYQVSQKIRSEFDTAKKSIDSVLIIDDLDKLIMFSNGNNRNSSNTYFCRYVMNSIIVLINSLGKTKYSNNIVVVTGTPDVVDYMFGDIKDNIEIINLQKIPIILKDLSNTYRIESKGFENYEEYDKMIDGLQSSICTKINHPIKLISHYDLFDIDETIDTTVDEIIDLDSMQNIQNTQNIQKIQTSNYDNNSNNSNLEAPIKYYIDKFINMLEMFDKSKSKSQFEPEEYFDEEFEPEEYFDEEFDEENKEELDSESDDIFDI